MKSQKAKELLKKETNIYNTEYSICIAEQAVEIAEQEMIDKAV